MKAFYGARFSPHMTKTPEGFLVCHGVPICRTGTQQYLPREIGVAGGENLVDVERGEAEVFKPSAVASFEGKPVTDDHPPSSVDASNYAAYTKGTVQNVHRGTGEDADKLVCDLVIYDAALIAKIDAGKRDISCGYDCVYVPNGDGTYHQADIIGNHVAVVSDGRAGHSVSIKDEKPKGAKKMPKKGSILQRMFAAFARDAEPEEIREAARAVDEAEEGGEQQPAPEPQPTQDEDMEMVMRAIHELNQKVQSLEAAQKAHDEEPPQQEKELRGLDALEEQLAGAEQPPQAQDDDGEESVTVPPEKLNEDSGETEGGDEEQPAPAEGEGEEQPPQAQDRAISAAMLRAMKPYIAQMPPRMRKSACDSISRAAKQAMRETQPLPGGYGALTQRRAANDALIKQGDPRAFGLACQKRNPHHKKD